MTKLVGILNITPDSFSDGGKYAQADAALAHAHALLDDGADIIDVGGQSTRPDATILDAMQEWSQLEPVLDDIVTLAHQRDKQVSVDTYHAATAERALAAGADWINDVSGGQDAALLDVVAQAGCPYVLMHSLTIPADKAVTLPDDADVVAVLYEYFARKLDALEASGIARDNIMLDPGIGFGKTARQSLALLWSISAFRPLGCSLYVGHSRKSCFRDFGEDRDAATLLTSHYLMSQQVDYVRVHDVAAHRTLDI